MLLKRVHQRTKRSCEAATTDRVYKSQSYGKTCRAPAVDVISADDERNRLHLLCLSAVALPGGSRPGVHRFIYEAFRVSAGSAT